MDRGAWPGYSLWDHKTVRHNWVTKQQQQLFYAQIYCAFLKKSSCWKIMYECIQSLYSVLFLLFIGFTTDPGGGILQEFTARSLKLFCKDSCRLRTESWSFCCYPVLMFTNKLRRLNQLFSSWVTIMSGCFFFFSLSCWVFAESQLGVRTGSLWDIYSHFQW